MSERSADISAPCRPLGSFGSHRRGMERRLRSREIMTFFRTHRSTIVNLSKIKEIVPAQSGVYDVFLTDAERTCVPLSRDRARVLREKYDF